ncbi:MAG: TetR/AcrR family transcriptional regulator [Defluviitaleaceae bacterium]|nr:TetR/AcrR family transcriptional regulator [Defluviitaleaceae bacterium]
MPRHEEKTKSEILNTAVRLFQEKGWDKVKIEDIVKEVGVTRGAFYHYFNSREHIIAAATDQIFLANNPFVVAEQQEGLNALEKLRFAIKHNLKFNLNEPELMNALKIVVELPDVFKSDFFFNINTTAPHVEKLLHEGNAQSIFKVKQPRQAAQVCVMLMSSWLNPGIFQVPHEEFIDKLDFMADMWENICGCPVMDDELKALLIHLQQKVIELYKK